MKKGLSLLQKSYKKGNVEAQFLIDLISFANGNMSEETFNLIKPIAEKDPSTIKKVYGIEGEEGKAYNSAEEMVSMAQCMLGFHYADGSGTEKSYEQAEYWLKKSLEHASEYVKKEVEEALKKLYARKQTQTSTSNSQVSAPSAITENTPSQTNEAPVYERPHYKMTDAEYKQMMKNPDFAKADNALNNAWKNAKKSLNANAFNVLKENQKKWISNGRDEWAEILADKEGEYGLSKNEAYTIATQARANYVSLWAKGYCAATVTGDKVNVRNKPSTKGKVLFQVSRYRYDYDKNDDYGRERLIVDSDPATDNKGDKWYKVFYRYDYTPDSDAPLIYEKANGYINGNFISLEYLTEHDYGLIVPPTVYGGF